jgi:two-component system response regulator MprA
VGTQRILIVEDDRSSRAALEEILRDEGYVVETATDGVDALRRVQASCPDLILSDVRMPRMGGLQLEEMLRAQKAGLPIIFMSAHSPPGDETWLSKPIQLDCLLSKVKEVLSSCNVTAARCIALL